MKRIIIILAMLCLLPIQVQALEIAAPEAPDAAQDLMPAESNSFAEDLWYVFCAAVEELEPEIAQSAAVCLGIVGILMLSSMVQGLPGNSQSVTEMAASLAIAMILFSNTHTMIGAATDTIDELSSYGKLLLPVMTAAMAAQGGTASSGVLYTGTAFFDTLLGSLISRCLVPMVYGFLALAVANSALGNDMLKKLRDMVKGVATWCLKTVLYIFTGYMTITGVVSGTTDQAAMKAAKLTISGAVPVVGGILSDASESVLVGASVVKNAVGIYGAVALFGVVIGPFLRIGVQYLLLKVTASVCSVFSAKRAGELLQDFSAAMGLLLGMTGAMCLIFMISIVCFLRGGVA